MGKFICKYCYKEFDTPQKLGGHIIRCKENPNYKKNLINCNNFNTYNKKNNENKECYCKYCNKLCKNDNSLKQHEIRCKENPNRIDVISNLINYNKIGHVGINQFTKAKKLRLEIPKFSKETREKQGKAWLGKQHTKEEKQKISNGIQKAILEHPESYSGLNSKAKKSIYNGVKFDSSWEIDVAKYLDRNNIKWERVNKGIKYLYENKQHHYYPDFYLLDLNYYIEVKGYQRDKNKDLCKWNTLNNLIILRAKEINDIKYNRFNIYEFIH